MLQEYALEHPDDIQILPILAQACVRLEAYDRAESFFRDYLDAVDEAERAHYDDIRLATSSEALAAFEQTPVSDKPAFLNSFWFERDPDLTTAANERRLEHYRRVWYSMQNFSKGKQPWDQRGEVYIRFGEPDHRSPLRQPELPAIPGGPADKGTPLHGALWGRSTTTHVSQVRDRSGWYRPCSARASDSDLRSRRNLCRSGLSCAQSSGRERG